MLKAWGESLAVSSGTGILLSSEILSLEQLLWTIHIALDVPFESLSMAFTICPFAGSCIHVAT